MNRRRLAVASAVSAVVAVAAAVLMHDARSWRDAIDRGDATYAETPARADWKAHTWLPGDPVGHAVDGPESVKLRRAIRLFLIAIHTGRGFDNGESRARARSAAQSALASVAMEYSGPAASQANDLLGVLEALGPGATADEDAAASFRNAVLADPANMAAKTNLELALRRLRAVSSRQGPGNGSGPRGTGRRGAGSGTPGRGY